MLKVLTFSALRHCTSDSRFVVDARHGVQHGSQSLGRSHSYPGRIKGSIQKLSNPEIIEPRQCLRLAEPLVVNINRNRSRLHYEVHGVLKNARNGLKYWSQKGNYSAHQDQIKRINLWPAPLFSYKPPSLAS